MLNLFSLFKARKEPPHQTAGVEKETTANPFPEGGSSSATYETLLGRESPHYSDIVLDPGFLPQIRLTAKPENAIYPAVRQNMLEAAYHGLAPYVRFACSLKGLAGRPDLHDALRVILLRFLARYWDMPASADNHHAYPWGFALHSLDVACGEAERAQTWTPISAHGIDEISQAQDLGFVVLLHFMRGLCHDAHKLYQYTMTWKHGAQGVSFDPLRLDGNVLDFKLVYPMHREESWKPPLPQPGKLNAMEFLSIFPRALWGYAPQALFFQIHADLFDLVSSDADQESARRDTRKAGRLTLEDMLANSIRAYFTTDKAKTNPAQHVFRVPGSEWMAVTASQFFLKVRPVSGGVYTADGVRACLLAQGALAGTTDKNGVNLPFLVRQGPDKAKLNTERLQISFVLASYLSGICLEAVQVPGEICFAEQDRAMVLELCPDAECFLPVLEQAPPGDAASAPAGEAAQQPAPAVFIQPERPLEKTGAPFRPAKGKPAKKKPPEPVAAASPVAWETRLQERLAHCTPADSDPEKGWLFCDLERVLVRPPHFYAALAGPELLTKEDWGVTAEALCRRLLETGWLMPESVKGTVGYIAPGGAQGSISGGFFALKLPEGEHARLLAELYAHPTQ